LPWHCQGKERKGGTDSKKRGEKMEALATEGVKTAELVKVKMKCGSRT